ncbi:MAG: PilT/PilU family type 4a pilus ATPase [Planctomycetes bacterium]|nr:PilT/PilU family type 4a pilus ATPase [Planctomycetota bacterium]
MAAEEEEPRIDDLFSRMSSVGASDLHLKAGNPPVFRIDGTLRRLKGKSLSAAHIEALARDWLGDEKVDRIMEQGSMDFGHEFEGGRVRVSVFMQRGRISLVARLVENVVPSREELHLPEDLLRIVDFNEGLCLVCGITGVGKSTTLAWLLNEMNEKHRRNILTFEDPIEFVYEDANSIINQREYRLDFHDWPEAIRAGVRADPDVMLIGEMRGQETFKLCLTAAETGHLVLTTMHTSSVKATFGRILDFFPTERHKFIRQSLAFNLKAIICQRLVPSFRDDVQRVPAVEMMWVNPPIRKAIAEGDDARVEDLIQEGEEEGMQSWTTSFVKLVQEDFVTKKVAREFAPNKDALEMALKGISFSSSSRSSSGD